MGWVVSFCVADINVGGTQKTGLSDSRALNSLSVHLCSDNLSCGDISLDQESHKSRKCSSSPQWLRTNSLSRDSTSVESTSISCSSVMEPIIKLFRSDFIFSPRDKTALMLSITNSASGRICSSGVSGGESSKCEVVVCWTVVGGNEIVDNNVSICSSRIGADRSRRAMRVSLRRLTVDRSGEEVGDGGAERVIRVR